MKFVKLYKDAALVLLNLVVLFVVVNLIGLAGLQARDLLKQYAGGAIPGNPWAERAKVYPGLSGDQIYRLFMESWEWRKYRYVPVSQLGESPYKGEFVNVAEAGYRKGQTELPWPPPEDAVTIFVFGGSTTFGYAVPDGETVPAYVQEALRREFGDRVLVYNFGRAYFYSTHEMLEFLRLLTDRHRPDIALFIDGLNEFYYQNDDLIWSERLRRLTADAQPSAWRSFLKAVRGLPAYVFTADLIRYLGGGKSADETARENVARMASGGGPEAANRVINRYLRNKALIEALGRHYGTATAFVWQPVPTYKYDRSAHLFADRIPERHAETGGAYEIARTRFDNGDFGNDVAWCADIQEGVDRPLYVDAVHYTAELSRLFAGCILEKSGLRAAVRRYRG